MRKDTAQHTSEHRVGGAGQDPAEELARLRAENARLLKAEKEWLLEREILSPGSSLRTQGGQNEHRRPGPAADVLVSVQSRNAKPARDHGDPSAPACPGAPCVR